uniref:Envelope glycoprotein gp130 n=1 Tax=Bovine foamy virus TaxID=207343 RepID=A0A4P2SQ83_9RETR|nr:envelope protein [Bovine foamy virus]
MAPPMTLQQWLQWRYNLETTNLLQMNPKMESVCLPDFEPPGDEEVSLRMKCKYWIYLCCATSTRIMAWIVFIFTVLSILLISVLIAVFRLQWKGAIESPGPILVWNNSNSINAQSTTPPHYSRLRRAIHLVQKPVQVNFTSIPQGLFLEPHPKPIISKERVLGLSQVVMVDSSSLTQKLNLVGEAKSLLIETINEEMISLQDVVLNFDLPLGDPHTQEEYIAKKCYQHFGHCYVVHIPGGKEWPTREIIQDQCPLNNSWSTALHYDYLPAWDYYNQPPPKQLSLEDFRKYNISNNGSRYEAYRLPLQDKIGAVAFCSPTLYSSWWNYTQSSREREELFRRKLETFLNPQTGRLNPKALPGTWHTLGKGKWFKDLTTYDFCKKPEAVFGLNKTYYSWSLWEGDCGRQGNDTQNYPPECRNYEKRDGIHVYGCRYWRTYSQTAHTSDNVSCYLSEDHCLFQPKWDSAEIRSDLGYLAYLGAFPSPICIEAKNLTDQDYKVTSIYAECVKQGKQYDIADVTRQLASKLTRRGVFLGDLPGDRAFSLLSDFSLPDSYQNKTQDGRRRVCSSKRTRRSINNWRRLQIAGQSMNQAITTLSKLSDLNDENLAAGIHLLQDHIITLMEATLHDVSLLGHMASIQHLHTHLATFKNLLIGNRVDWSVLESRWIQEELKYTDEVMNVIRRTARSITYDVQNVKNTSDSTIWEIYIYYELILPERIWIRNWQVANLGHLTYNSGHLTHVTIHHPYEIVNQDCEELTFLHLVDCHEQDYLICEEVVEVEPCGNLTGSDCPVLAENIQAPYVYLHPLKNGSYLLMASHTDCSLPPYEPVVVTVNDSLECYGKPLKRPLTSHTEIKLFAPQIPQLRVRLPHLVGIIAKLKSLKIKVTSTWESIKDQIHRSKQELLRLDLHEGDYSDWILQLGNALEDVWPVAASAVSTIGTLLEKATGTLFGNVFSILAYAKPVIIGIILIILLLLVIRILRWLAVGRQRKQK